MLIPMTFNRELAWQDKIAGIQILKIVENIFE